MHGSILSALRGYVIDSHGAATWARALKTAGLEGHLYLPAKEYPDNEAIALVGAASELTGSPIIAVLQGFGEYLAPILLKMYGALIVPSWRTLDLLENTETTIHRVVRMRNPGAHPPSLRCQRTGDKEVEITYASERRMCGLAIGIVQGIAGHFHEEIKLSEPQCMQRGDPACLIRVRAI